MKSLRAGLDTGCAMKSDYSVAADLQLFARITQIACVSIHAAAAVLMLFLSACADKPVIVSADTSCESFKHIAATDAQRAALKADWTLWESYAVQIAAHNVTYDGKCLKPVAGP